MIQPPSTPRGQNDDRAPNDYTFVSSVREGRMQEAQRSIHPDRPQPAVRRRATPGERRSGTVTLLPEEESAIPDNPYEKQEALRRRSRSREEAPGVIVTEDGSQFDPPAMMDMPEWYRVAQQNVSTTEERMRRAPRVQAAPAVNGEEPRERFVDNARRYEEAGYPPELLREQRELDERQDAISRRRRHGAQHAVSQSRQEEYQRRLAGEAPAPRSSYPPAREEYARRRELTEEERFRRVQAVRRAQERQYQAAGVQEGYGCETYPAERSPYAVYSEEEETPRRFSVPWAGVAAFALAALAVALWLAQMNFETQTRQILQERTQTQIALQNNHPLEYRELIEREARKNNLHPAFVEAIVLNESSYRTGAESNVGARGLMQVMEETAADIARELDVTDYSFDMLYEAETNLTFGCYYLGKLSQRFQGDPTLVAMAYHAGATQVQNWLNSSAYSLDGRTLILDNLPDGPSKQYAARVKRDFAVYRRLYYETLEEDA